MPTLTKIGRNTIHDSAVSTAQLEDGSVAVADIGTNAVGNDELINSESYTVGGLTSTGNAQVNGTTLSKGALTVGDTSASPKSNKSSSLVLSMVVAIENTIEQQQARVRFALCARRRFLAR